jgi:hypothetical protein
MDPRDQVPWCHVLVELRATEEELSSSAVKSVEKVFVVVSLTANFPPMSKPVVFDSEMEKPISLANELLNDVLVPSVVLLPYWTVLKLPGGA